MIVLLPVVILQAVALALGVGTPLPLGDWLYSFVATTCIAMLGIWAFRRTEANMADRL
jgi:hypothetical protein